MASVDAEQLKLMQESCILVNDQDQAIGSASKRDCHQHDGHSDVALHRAFSVFLFNSQGELLLQRRASAKITFSDRWTNTCCSHPLAELEGETEEHAALGVKRAAQRKLEHELGIKHGSITIDDLHYLTKIHYGAHSDSQWGEHEIDWILFAVKDVELHPNPNEVSAVEYVSESRLKQLIHEHRDTQTVLTPWFELIAVELLFGWWRDLQTICLNDGVGDEQKTKIHRLGKKALKHHVVSNGDNQPNGSQHLTH